MAIRKLLTRGALVLASFTLAAAANIMTWGTAHAATMPARAAHNAAWYDTATCKAFMHSHGQPGRPGYQVMVRDARHADTYLKVDVGLLAAHYTGTAARYVLADCTMTPDQAASL